MSLASSNDLVGFLLIGFFALVGYIWLKHNQIQNIRKSAKVKGWIILNISSLWFTIEIGRKDGFGRYCVKYKDEEGYEQSTDCTSSAFGGVDWDV